MKYTNHFPKNHTNKNKPNTETNQISKLDLAKVAKSQKKKGKTTTKLTGENNEIWFLSEDHPVDKDGGVEVRATLDLAWKHIKARSGLSISIVHVRHL